MLRAEAQEHPLAAVLQEVGPESCPGRFNFHCHTVCSDGSLAPEALALQALEIGLEHLAVTDHHALVAHDRIAAVFAGERAAGRPAPTLWRGVEISCLLEGCLVHVLVHRHDHVAADVVVNWPSTCRLVDDLSAVVLAD